MRGVDHVDIVVTLHACGSATDYALEKAVQGLKVILSVPCCQHELNKQIKNDLFGAGAALRPDQRSGWRRCTPMRCVRSFWRHQGYRTQILEFIDMEHTPKNILLRAVYDGKPKRNEKEIREILDFLQVRPTLYELLRQRKKRKNSKKCSRKHVNGSGNKNPSWSAGL